MVMIANLVCGKDHALVCFANALFASRRDPCRSAPKWRACCLAADSLRGGHHSYPPPHAMDQLKRELIDHPAGHGRDEAIGALRTASHRVEKEEDHHLFRT
jgi:hypothetical protein